MPDDYEIGKWIEGRLRRCFESFGYHPIDVPVIEYTDLYLRKSGEDIISRLYDFTHQNRRLCLRPEMTASIARAYVDNMERIPLPDRLYYIGPVFRYERPQRGRYRQFTQMGIELIGAAGAMADAEVIYAACKGLDILELANYRVIIGHIGILAEFLESLALEGSMCRFLLASMEALRREGRQYIVNRLREIYPAFQPQALMENTRQDFVIDEHERRPTNGPKKMTNLFRGMDEAEARMAILDLLENMNIELDGNRHPDEIVDRLLAKIKRQDQTPRISQALEFMSELGQLLGGSDEVLKEAEKLLKAHSIDRSPLNQLRAIVEILEYYNLDRNRITLDFGLSRGLQYYTGAIFEIHHGTLAEPRQLCGGGRYDDLIATLGGRRNIPATGFSYGLERIHLALESEGKLMAIAHRPADVLLIPVGSDDYGTAITVAEQLRHEGLKVEIDVRGKSVKSNFHYADKQAIPFAIVVGSQERLASQVVLRDMASREEQRVMVSDVAKWINKLKERHA